MAETTIQPYCYYDDADVLAELADIARQLTGNLIEHDAFVAELFDKRDDLIEEAARRGLTDPATGMPFTLDEDDTEPNA
jgi:hypothetical protein